MNFKNEKDEDGNK